MASRLLIFSDLRRLNGIDYSRDQLRRLVKAGKFPQPRRIPGSHRIFFVESEIVAWLDNLPTADQTPLKRERHKNSTTGGGNG